MLAQVEFYVPPSTPWGTRLGGRRRVEKNLLNEYNGNVYLVVTGYDKPLKGQGLEKVRNFSIADMVSSD